MEWRCKVRDVSTANTLENRCISLYDGRRSRSRPVTVEPDQPELVRRKATVDGKPIMDDSSHLKVTASLVIPRSELHHRASRAGGPGGQHVNTSSTRIEVLWDLTGSRAVTDEERERIRVKLAARLDADGMVRVVASDRRSQQQNRQAAEERLASLIKHALHVPKKRRATKPTRAAKERRLTDKKKRSERKRDRRGDAD